MKKSILKLALMPLALTVLSTGTAQANHAQYDMQDTDLSDKRMKKLFRKKGFTYRSQTISANCNFMDVSHSDGGENLIDVKAEEKERHMNDHKSHGSGTTYGSSHDGA